MINFPCKNCEKRYPGCHDKCCDYQEARKKQDEVLKAIKEKSDVVDCEHYRKNRMHRIRNKYYNKKGE